MKHAGARLRSGPNDGVLRFLGSRPGIEHGVQPVSVPNDRQRCYWEAGSHPEVVERVWNKLGRSLPDANKLLVFGTPALVSGGVVVAFALGTRYALRLPRRFWDVKQPAGASAKAKWSNGETTDLTRECGQGWVFGSFGEDEVAWCEEATREWTAEDD